MPSDPRLAALPALRKRAEEEAKTLADVCADTFALHMGDDMPAMYERGWDGMHEDERDALTAAHLTLLSDLSRPASRDAVARLVAEALGLRAYATAPTLRRHLYMRGARWELGDGDLRCVWHGVPTDHSSHQNYIYAPDIAATGDAAEALTLIAVSVLGGAS